ncbi:PREDICTED: TGF-beta-activated kinase 1 and MAP3K7-binding protein 2 isoform X1 [Eufriesea mexicana]|uniref:TGF-beta-activated kinase 1 and MAP3K7-binding protein 2 isoform X1 n=2 Tax=Eufriesea mexicana TaxID=516756 RepID=UPI00083C8F38|nr:PREDICTED: TGF-beta-activated kinase 1 and MAP3K7-binding protein 2 isoform X1 [Eufriesea mexicana]XP_017761560.1 PREDICTED: TGF-beta-activated kinase 1 and MAP3K7-binding protein 2 isoform X1 [Eufriesea mexicana]XP_017761561.1 PREDICTED: TGF-beta-activated kinase 1 and MAP3K7-binding protein 2 isoform X1 [Eufriesea mexicana]XP_017761562.1 PREDICTED: TGF-beta-activated kinase 1 and MAP3K7-binding protein 2 isoform X1 [Eufriesea mexicana]
MGECHCSNIAIMQLFHELKQQFPALPDHVVSQCIAQNSHDRETCARSLRATQESRQSPGAFPPAALCGVLQQQQQHHQRANHVATHQQRCCAMSQAQRGCGTSNNASNNSSSNTRPHRPASLDIGMARRCPISCTRIAAISGSSPIAANPVGTPSSAPAVCTTRGFFDDCTGPSDANCLNKVQNAGNEPAGFELNVNVACSPAGNRDFRTVPTIGGACKRSDLLLDPRTHYAEPLLNVENTGQIDHTRSYTSVSLTLRPPSSEPQPPIDIRSQGSSLTYSSSSLDPRGFQSRLQISIGAGAVGSVAAARIRPPMGPIRPNSLIPPVQTGPQRPPGLPAGPPSQLPRPTTTMSAPTTPSVPSTTNIVPPISLPTTPSGPTTTSPPSSPLGERIQANSDQNRSPLNQVAEHQKKLVAEQLARKERLARELRAEKGRLEAMKKELQSLTRPFDSSMPPQELKKKLRSEIYQLQVECDRLADEVDQWSDPRVPLGETNEKFYQHIYTGQPLPSRSVSSNPPPLPSQPPAWQPELSGNNIDREERDGPSWVCRMCTFDNHPLMNKCEQCDMPRLLDHGNTGETQDIHIRVTHHHNFSPSRTVHSWVV